jgi:Ca2+-binding EF-hand superfamily protein
MTSSSKLIAAHAVLGDTMIQRLQFYRSLNGFQQLVLTQIVKTLPLQSKAELIVLFSEISGQTIGICFENFSKAMKNAGYKLTKGEIKNFFSRLDINQDGRIDVDEFCAAFLDWYTIQLGTQWETSLKGTFESLDLDGDGKLTLGDVHRVLTKSVSHSYLTDAARCFQAADRDMKGFICFQDFRALLNIRENAWKYFPKRVY